MTTVQIKDFDTRLEKLEEALSDAATGTLEELELEHDDDFSSIEAGFNVVITDLRAEIEKSSEMVENLDTLVQERTAELQVKLDYITEQNELIGAQQLAIAELSTPVLQLWDDVIALPVIGVVDTRRSSEIMERLLAEITTQQARFVILDITGVEVVDTKTADHFIKVVKASELLGARCIITGIRPAVAQTLVEIGVDLASISTVGNLKEGLKLAIRQLAAHK